MRERTNNIWIREISALDVVTKSFTGLISFLLFLILVAGSAHAQIQWPQLVVSQDGTPISYEVSGAGEPTLVFVHGWSCDARYWRAQVAHFAKKHRVIVLDLAGHGHSGMDRRKYTMAAFGRDVRAVVDAAGGGRTILIGHSMGGTVIVEAAKLLPGRVIGLIGVDTLDNIEYPLTQKGMDNMMAPLKKDFRAGTRAFAGSMFLPDANPIIRDWVLADMSA
ncbi:MAG: alpha/beta hydrolase, partial [Smithellaceae bacterium]